MLTFNELRSFASKQNVPTKGMKRNQIEATLAEMNIVIPTTMSEGKRRGRPMNPNSERQARLARKGTVKRGRPVNVSSERQARLARKGTVKRGRPVNPNSVRQITLAAKATVKSAPVVE